MANPTLQFPFPLLYPGSTDYQENCRFSIGINDIRKRVEKGKIIIPVGYDLECKGLKQFISNGRAAVAVSISCSPASYRELFYFPTDKTSLDIKISQHDVIENVELKGLIIAKQEIHGFHCNEFNAEIFDKEELFDIEIGSILAQGELLNIPLNENKPIESIFQFIKAKKGSEQSSIYADFEDDLIKIHLKEEAYSLYVQLRRKKSTISIMVMPALVEALSKMKSDNNDPTSLMWKRVINQKLSEKNLTFENFSLTELADRLLEDISYESLLDMQNIINYSLDDNPDE